MIVYLPITSIQLALRKGIKQSKVTYTDMIPRNQDKTKLRMQNTEMPTGTNNPKSIDRSEKIAFFKLNTRDKFPGLLPQYTELDL